MKSLIAIAVALAFPRFSVVGEGGGGIPVEQLMDASLDDLKDLPGFEVPPKGHYKLQISLEQKVVNDHPSIEAKCTVLETLELASANDKKVEDGTKFGQLFMMDNEWGQGGFKGFAMQIAVGLGLNPKAKISEVAAQIQDLKIAATINHRYHREDRNKPIADRRTYADLINVTVL